MRFVQISILFLLVYNNVFVIPEEKALLRECEIEILCQKEMLTGSVCKEYLDPVGFFDITLLNNSTGV